MLKTFNQLSNYKKGTLNLFQGAFWAQIIGFLGTFIIAKIYGADTIGVFSKFISISSVLAILFTLRLESVFVLDINKNNTNDVFSSIVYSIIFSSSIILVLTLLIPNSFLVEYNLYRLLLLFSVVGGILKSLENTLISHLLTIKGFSHLSKAKVIFVISRYSIQCLLFLIDPHTGLIYGFLIALLIILGYYKTSSKISLTTFNSTKYKSFLKKNSNLASFGVLSDNLNALNLNIIPIVAGAFFSNEKIGWYFIALVILSVPATLINTSYSKVFFLKAAEIFNSNKKNLFQFVSNQLSKLSAILIFPFIFFFFLSKPIISLFLNNEWIIVGDYIQILCVLFYLRSIYNPVSYLEDVFKKNHLGLLFNCYLLVSNLIAIYLGAENESFIYMLKLMTVFLSFGYAIMILFFILYTKRISKKDVA